MNTCSKPLDPRVVRALSYIPNQVSYRCLCQSSWDPVKTPWQLRYKLGGATIVKTTFVLKELISCLHNFSCSDLLDIVYPRISSYVCSIYLQQSHLLLMFLLSMIFHSSRTSNIVIIQGRQSNIDRHGHYTGVHTREQWGRGTVLHRGNTWSEGRDNIKRIKKMTKSQIVRLNAKNYLNWRTSISWMWQLGKGSLQKY